MSLVPVTRPAFDVIELKPNPTEINITEVFAAPKVLAKWEFRLGVSPNLFRGSFQSLMSVIYCEAKVPTGLISCRIQISQDDSNWSSSNYATVAAGSTDFEGVSDEVSQPSNNSFTDILEETNYMRIIAFNSIAAQAGVIRNFGCKATMYFAPKTIVVRVI